MDPRNVNTRCNRGWCFCSSCLLEEKEEQSTVSRPASTTSATDPIIRIQRPPSSDRKDPGESAQWKWKRCRPRIARKADVDLLLKAILTSLSSTFSAAQ